MQRGIVIKALLKKLNKTLELIAARELAGVGLTFSQIAVLKQLADGPKTIGQVSQAVDLSHGTVSGIVDRLERDGWVKRIRCQDDRRVVWIRQTEKVRQIKDQVPIFRDDYFSFLLEGLDEEEQQKIVEVLQRLIAQLEKKVGEKP